MENRIESDYVKMKTEIKCEMICEEDIKTEIVDNSAAEREVYDLKIKEYHPMDFATSVKVEDINNSGDISDVFNIVDSKSLPNHGSAADYAPLKDSSVHPEHNKRKITAQKTSTSQRTRKRKKKEDITFACGFCSETFSKSKHFFSHVKSHSLRSKSKREGSHLKKTTLKTFQTDITPEIESATNRKIQSKQQNGIFQCDECMKTFTFQNNLKRHKLLHSETTRPICDICKKSYNKKGYLIQHIQTVHLKAKNDTLFVCDVCNRTVNTAYALRCHMQIHTGNKPFECHICGKGFSNKWNLKVHLKSH